MTEDTSHWSCYTTTPARSLEIFENARPLCPLAHSSEHDGFHMLLKYADVKSAMADNQTFSSEPQVLRPMLPRKPIPALEMDPPRHTARGALCSALRSPRKRRGKWNRLFAQPSIPTSMTLSKRAPATLCPIWQNQFPPKPSVGSSASMTGSFQRCVGPPSKCSQRRVIPMSSDESKLPLLQSL